VVKSLWRVVGAVARNRPLAGVMVAYAVFTATQNAVWIAMFGVPAALEGLVLVPISLGHGLSLVDSVALVPLLAGTGLLLGGLWQRRQRLDAALTRRPWSARAGAFVIGLGLGLLVASVFAFFWWCRAPTTTLLDAAVVAAGGEDPRVGSGW
jgi:hypothetical protein